MDLLEDVLGRLRLLRSSGPTPAPVVAVAFLGPFVLAYLAYTPRTRLLRTALWPVQVMSLSWMIASADFQGNVIWTMFVVLFAMMLNLLCIPQWLWNDPPSPTIPAGTHWPKLRASKPFKAVNLIIDSFRHTTFPPDPSIARPSPPAGPRATERRATYLQLGYHFSHLILHQLLLEVFEYPGNYLVPMEHPILGLGEPLGRSFWLLSAGLASYNGTCALWHAFALLFIGSGVYTGEEFPKFFNKPFLADSMNDLWGRRWHQVLKIPMSWWTRSLALSRPLRILTIFTLSAAFHVPQYYSTTGHWRSLPHFSLFAGSGLVALLERAIYKYTGRRVRGTWGRVWLWCWLAVVGSKWADNEWTYGWARYMRSQAREHPEGFMLNWLLYVLRVVQKRPTEWNLDP